MIEHDKRQPFPYTNGCEIFYGNANPQLAEKVAQILRVRAFKPVTIFPDYEVYSNIPFPLRRKDAFIIQSTAYPRPNDYLMELCMMVDSARSRSADYITVVIPCYGYARSDWPSGQGVAIGARMVASILTELGVNQIVTYDIHASQEQGFTNRPWTNLYGSDVLAPEILKQNLGITAVVTPDLGAAKRGRAWLPIMKLCEDDVVFCDKKRSGPDTKQRALIGDVKRKTVLLVDDELASGGSLFGAAKLAMERGATKVYAAVTHGKWLSDGAGQSALNRLTEAPIIKLFVTDTIVQPLEVINHPKVQVVSVASHLANVLHGIHLGKDF